MPLVSFKRKELAHISAAMKDYLRCNGEAIEAYGIKSSKEELGWILEEIKLEKNVIDKITAALEPIESHPEEEVK